MNETSSSSRTRGGVAITNRRSMAEQKCYRTRGNMLGGPFLSWALVVMAITLLNPAIIAPGDELPGDELLLVAISLTAVSFGAHVVFTRPAILVTDEHYLIRNPLCDHTVSRSATLRIIESDWFHPILIIDERKRVRLWALEWSLAAAMNDSSTQKRFARLIDRTHQNARPADDDPPSMPWRRRWLPWPPSVFVVALTLAWVGFYVFVFPEAWSARLLLD